MRSPVRELWVLRNGDKLYWNEEVMTPCPLEHATTYSNEDSGSGNVPLPTGFYWAKLIDAAMI